MDSIDLKNQLIELYRRTSVELPQDIVLALEKAAGTEKSALAKEVLGIILENVNKAKKESKPICQDTGSPTFYIEHSGDCSEKELRIIIDEVTVIATKEIPLRPNAVDILENKNLGNKAKIHFQEAEKFKASLLLKGGGSENVSAIYSLPDSELTAGRDLKGVKKCVLDAIFKAQGKGCPPYIIGVASGGSIEEVAYQSKKQLLREITDINPNDKLNTFEKNALSKVNELNIGPLGLGGKTTALAVKATTVPRHPASFFVGVSIGCWCLRRQSL